MPPILKRELAALNVAATSVAGSVCSAVRRSWRSAIGAPSLFSTSRIAIHSRSTGSNMKNSSLRRVRRRGIPGRVGTCARISWV
jgi:hypothetical protein